MLLVALATRIYTCVKTEEEGKAASQKEQHVKSPGGKSELSKLAGRELGAAS